MAMIAEMQRLTGGCRDQAPVAQYQMTRHQTTKPPLSTVTSMASVGEYRALSNILRPLNLNIGAPAPYARQRAAIAARQCF